MIGLFKIGWGFIVQYRFWIMATAITGALTALTVFYGNAKANAAKLVAANEVISELRLDLSAARVELDARNDRIRALNARQLQELQYARDLLNESLAMSAALKEERDRVKEELEVTRFELLETIRDDEDFADWVDWDVPTAAWGLLQQAAQGTPDS